MAIANGTCVSFCNRPKEHFGLPGYAPETIAVIAGKCYMDGKSEDSMLVKRIPIYLQPFTSYSEILVGNCNFFLPHCI